MTSERPESQASNGRSEAMAGDVVLVDRIGAVALVTLNRPECLNALNEELMRALRKTIEALAADEAVRCVVVTGAGKGFCPGADRNAVKRAYDAPEQAERERADPMAEVERRAAWLRRSVEAARLLHEMPKPTVAMVNGVCAGAGLSIAAACDLRFAGESASFLAGYTQVGLSSDYGGIWFLTRILGAAKARRLHLLNERMGADEALAFGLADKVFADAQLRARTLELAEAMTALPASGLALAKQNLNAACSESLGDYLDRESRNMALARQALRRAPPKP